MDLVRYFLGTANKQFFLNFMKVCSIPDKNNTIIKPKTGQSVLACFRNHDTCSKINGIRLSKTDG